MSLAKQNKLLLNKAYLTVNLLGNTLKLNIKYKSISNIELTEKSNELILFLPKKYKTAENIEVIDFAIKSLYKKVADTEIESALEIARHSLNFAPEDYKLERLKNKFYKCTKDKILIINPDIVQFSSEIIITTLIQAFCKIQYKTNSNSYKEALKNGLRKYESYKANSLLKATIA